MAHETDTSKDKAIACAAAALNKKAENLKILHVGKAGGFTEYFLICSAMSDRQVAAIAESVSDAVKANYGRPLRIEGLQDGRWVLIDLGDVIVHVFLDALREFYNLEGLWSNAPKVTIPQELYF
jgi:ribosome-associated protein